MTEMNIKKEPSLVTFECDAEVKLETDIIKEEPFDEGFENEIELTEVKSEFSQISSINGLDDYDECGGDYKINVALPEYGLLVPNNSKESKVSTVNKSEFTIKCSEMGSFSCLETSSKSYKCKMCKKRFDILYDLRQHTLTHQGRRFSCDVCNKEFSRKDSLNTHMRIHTYVCNLCNKKFSRREGLRRHSVIHTGKRPFACDVCGKDFTQKSRLNSHKHMHSNINPYVCNVCDKAFTRMESLHRHRVTHTGEKPFPCDICGKNYTQLSNLYTHKRNIHNNLKPFNCDVCNRKFNRRSSLCRHKLTHAE